MSSSLPPESEFGGQNFCPSLDRERNGGIRTSSDFSDSQSWQNKGEDLGLLSQNQA